MSRSFITAGLALAVLSSAAPAGAAPYTLFVYESAAEHAKRADTGAAGKAYWDAYAALGREMAAAGIMRGGAALKPAAVAQVVGGGGTKPAAFASQGLELGGYFIIDVPTPEDAAVWARKIPAAATEAVEIRPALPTPGM